MSSLNFKILKKNLKNNMKKIEIILLCLCIGLLLIGGIWAGITQWSWLVNDTKVSFSDRWNLLMSGPVYFLVPGVLIRLVLLFKYKI